MGTVQELVASISLPDQSKQQLQKVMQQIGYADDDKVDEVLRALTARDVKEGAEQAGLNPPLTLGEKQTLLLKTQSTGELVLSVGLRLQVSLRERLAKVPPKATWLWRTGVLASTGPVRRCFMGWREQFWDLAGLQSLPGGCHGHKLSACAPMPGSCEGSRHELQQSHVWVRNQAA